MAQSQLISGLWALPTVESNVEGTVRMHVSVSVPEVGSLGDVPISVDLTAGGTALTVTEAATPDRYYYLETISVTLIADFAFDNPDRLAPDTATITIGGESATFPVTVREPDLGPPIV